MTDSMKCPFCGAELAPHIDEWKSIRKLFICNNTGCFCWGQPMLLEIWQALIDGKKAKQDLEIAKSYVKGISEMVINSGDNIYIVIGHFKKLAEQTLEQIEHKG